MLLCLCALANSARAVWPPCEPLVQIGRTHSDTTAISEYFKERPGGKMGADYTRGLEKARESIVALVDSAHPVEGDAVSLAFDGAKSSLDSATGAGAPAPLVQSGRILYGSSDSVTMLNALTRRGLKLRTSQAVPPEGVLGLEPLPPSKYGLSDVPVEYQPILDDHTFIYAPSSREAIVAYDAAVARGLNSFHKTLAERNQWNKGTPEWKARQEQLIREIGHIAAVNNSLHRYGSGNFSLSHLLTNELLVRIGENRIYPGALDRLLFYADDPGEVLLRIVRDRDHFQIDRTMPFRY